MLVISDDDIDKFFKSAHNSNNSRALAAKIIIPSNVPTAVNVILFKLEDMSICNALPKMVDMLAINATQIHLMRRQRADAKEHQARRDNLTHHKMEVPEL